MADCPDNDKSLNAAYPETGTSSLVGNVNETVANAATAYDLANKLTSAAKDYNALNNVVNQLIGYEVRWFRAVPQQRSKDVIFQEYTLSNVEETPLCVKAIVPNGQFPDSKYNYDLMGLEYEVPLEIQIDKKYWESIAGFGTAPQKKDIVYFPMPNKLYEVESCYLYRGFMEQETAWKINLKKYQYQASRKESAALQDTIDQYTVSVEELFGEAIDNDVKKLVDDQQMSQFNATSKDKYKALDASLSVVSIPLDIYGTRISQSYYDLQNTKYTDAITYNLIDSIGDHSDRSLTAWVMLKDDPTIHIEGSVISITADSTPYVEASTGEEANYNIVFSTTETYNIGDTIVIYREGALNFYAFVLGITAGNPNTYHCQIDTAVVTYLDSIKTGWASMRGYKVKRKSPVNIMDGTDTFGNHTFTANIYANQYIKINYGTQEYVACLSDRLLDDKWYGIVVNIGNQWKQYNVYVWEQHETDTAAKLQIFFYETMKFIPEVVSVTQFTINKSPSYLTNIRLFNVTIEEERQSNELLSFFTKDADQAILLDNVDIKLIAPYITRQR